MKEVHPEKGLEYTEAEFDQAMADGHERQSGAVEDNTLISESDAQQITIISLMRIYDVLSAILNHHDPELAEALLKLHGEGKLAGPLPSLNLE